MPLLNITVKEGKSAQYIQQLSQIIHSSLVETWHIPLRDYFHVIHQAPKEHMIIDEKMWGMNRSDDVVVIQITSIPRSKEMKCDFYRVVTSALEKSLNINPDDILINIVTSQLEDWSFGRGQAQLLVNSVRKKSE